MGEFDFPSALHLKRPSEFRAVFDGGVKRHTRDFVLFRAANGSAAPRLGVSVSRRIGGAVVRNRVKRLIRESFRLHWRVWGLGGEDLVVIAKGGAAGLGLWDVSREFAGAVAGRGRR